MKTLLYMAISANGCVADAEGNTPWSDAEWKNFKRIVKSCGNIIIGRRTFEQMAASDGFADMGRPCVVAVSSKYQTRSICGHRTVNTPKQALNLVRRAGYKKALIVGGTKLNSSFFEQNLVGEIMLDVEPFLFSKGLPLIMAPPFVRKLKLLAAKKYKGGVNLHYKILETK
jgi:dihydrofolate reductase